MYKRNLTSANFRKALRLKADPTHYTDPKHVRYAASATARGSSASASTWSTDPTMWKCI